MSDEQELKLACLHQAGGHLEHAKSLFEWVSGSVRATPASEAPAVSAPDQDKPEQPFNYQHPSKYGTDVPRRCYLEELTPEERAIRDLVGAIEHLGAHPLLTTTVIQLMKAGESLADWVDIGLRDKAIAALSTDPERPSVIAGLEQGECSWMEERTKLEGDVKRAADALLSFMNCGGFSLPMEGESAGLCVQVVRDDKSADLVRTEVIAEPDREDQKNPPSQPHQGDEETGGGLLETQSPSVDDEVRNQAEDAPPEVASEGEAGSNIQKVNITQPAVPEGWTPAAEFQFDGLVKAGERVPVVMALYEDGAECAGDNGIIGAWVFPTRDCRVIAYRILATPPGIIETPAEAERTEVDSQAQAATEQEPEDESTPVLDALPPSIPRSEIPEGAAVETFTDAGVETVKIGGITHIVEDKSEPFKAEIHGGYGGLFAKKMGLVDA